MFYEQKHPEIEIFYMLLATAWFVITTIPVLLPKVPHITTAWRVRLGASR